MLKSSRPTRRMIAVVAFAAACSTSAVAQEAAQDCELRIAGGPAGKVYDRMIRDMRAVCAPALSVCPVASTGGLQNLSLMAANEAELGIVQVDTLREMKAGQDDALQSLQIVMPLHANLLHVVTLAEGSLVDAWRLPWTDVKVPWTGTQTRFEKLSQLRGRTIVAVGSAQLMARMLETPYNLGLRVLAADNDTQALAALRANQAQAVFTLGGWPLPVVAQQRAASGLMLADFDLQATPPYALVTRSYQHLGAHNLRFIAAPNVLLTRPFKRGGPAARRVATLHRCLTERLDELQEGRYQPAWKEIRDPAATYGIEPIAAYDSAGALRLATRSGTKTP